jgi:hypothetical protein
VTKQEPDLKLENIDIKSGSSNLYFSHMQEDLDTSTLLQQTFTAKGEVGKIISDYVSPKIQSGCKILQTRTNSGDNLYANGQLVDTSASFNAVFNCTFQLDDQGNYIPGSSCTRTPVVTFAVSTKTPLANNTFSNLVVGSNSIVRRIFPKIGVDSLIGSFYDIPASTTVTYSGAKEGTGNIYIPHVGSVDEYFLKGIQTLLRPKGYGEQITFAAPGHKYASCGTAFAQFNPPSSTTDKAKSYFDLYIKQYLTDDLISIYAEAEKQTGLPCEVFAGVHFREGSNDPNRDLESGAPLNGRSLLDSAIKVGNEILGKMGGSITTWDELSEALSRYNGLGNHNCPPQIPPLPYSVPYSTCPAKYMGEDDPYSLAWIDSNHENMFLIWCADGIQCTSLTEFPDPGALTVATEMYLSKIR